MKQPQFPKIEKPPAQPNPQEVYPKIRDTVRAVVAAERALQEDQNRGNRSREMSPDAVFLGSGSNTEAYAVDIDGVPCVALVPHSYRKGVDVEPRALVLAKAHGIPHTPQLVAYSKEDSTIVMTRCPGLDFWAYRNNAVEVPDYTDAQLATLLHTVASIADAGIEIDPKPSNFLYDRDKGFSVVDLASEGTRSHEEHFRWAARALEHFMRKPESLETLTKEERLIAWQKTDLEMKVRFMRVLKEQYPQEAKDLKEKQGTEEGFLWQKLKDTFDVPELNALYAELEEAGVAWDEPTDEFEQLAWGTNRSNGVEGTVERNRKLEEGIARNTLQQGKLAEQGKTGWENIDI